MKYAPIQIELQPRGNDWVAYQWGKSSPILRRSPGNTVSRDAARWPTPAAAIAELPALLGGVEITVVRCGKCPNPCPNCGACHCPEVD